MLDIRHFDTQKAGPRLVILGGVHGNEICGPIALQRVIKEIESGVLALEAGKLTLVPICNPRAYAEDKRFIDRNLNRAFRIREKPEKYEEFLMNELAPVLQNCDMLVDIHSYTAGGPPFALRGPDGEKASAEETLIAHLYIATVVYGWEHVYENLAIQEDKEQSVGTIEYARRFGATAVTIECGQHRDAAAPDVAYNAIKGALKYSGVCPSLKLGPASALTRIRMKQLVIKERLGGFTKDWKHLDTVRRGEHLATFEDGTPIFAPFDARMVMPNAKCPIGQEWFYLGVDE